MDGVFLVIICEIMVAVSVFVCTVVVGVVLAICVEAAVGVVVGGE